MVNIFKDTQSLEVIEITHSLDYIDLKIAGGFIHRTREFKASRYKLQ